VITTVPERLTHPDVVHQQISDSAWEERGTSGQQLVCNIQAAMWAIPYEPTFTQVNKLIFDQGQ